MTSRFVLHAHRGASHLAPENTLAAFEHAVAERADYIELDVRLTSDDVPIVFHDDDLVRMTGAAGRVSDTSFATFADLRAGGQPIPLLSDLIAFTTTHRVPLNIELKPLAKPLVLVAACEPILRELMALTTVMVSSFDPRVLAMLHPRLPDLHLALIVDNPKALAALTLLPRVALHLRYDLIDEASLPSYRDVSSAIRAWTVDDAHEARRLMALDITDLITNRPGPLRAELALES